MVGDSRARTCFTTSNVFRPAAYPPLDVSIEELTFGDVDPVPCDGQFQLFVVRAGVHRRAVFTGYTQQGAPKSTRTVLPYHHAKYVKRGSAYLPPELLAGPCRSHSGPPALRGRW